LHVAIMERIGRPSTSAASMGRTGDGPAIDEQHRDDAECGDGGRSPGAAGGTGGQSAPGALASLVLGILGLTVLPLIGAALALVFGYQSKSAARAEPARYSDELGRVGRILGWVGFVLPGLVVVASLAVFYG
jgi:hypothetical protein